MGNEVLSGVFESYAQNQFRTQEVASHVDEVVKSFLGSEFGSNLENSDGFTDTPANRQVSTIRMKEPDKFGTMSEMVLEIFAEGRAQISAMYLEDDEIKDTEQRILHFHSHETPLQIAGRIASSMADFQNNEVAELFSRYAEKMIAEIKDAPGVIR
ncbi:hypothetical protein [Hyphomonas jannaschiana]|uniref:Uncharacterized protein n=1 Tax=Hyphomonas jannaschiana VP2 TaxID=1280952 RepID=A0A059FGV7_9PROT|nr:hypothetical protein [Hyphomonas jannaschiana]KCZ89733.1 hypothetical protein HJA_05762 [Hyphomonas jannaschiana VP2]